MNEEWLGCSCFHATSSAHVGDELALALARPSAVLVLDEPEQRLDPGRLDLVSDALRARARAGTAIVLASHSPRLVEQLADGRLALEEPW